MSEGKFFTFPLCLLALPQPDSKLRLQFILASALERAGGNAEIDYPNVRSYVSDNCLRDFDHRSERHKAFVRGAIVCAVTIRGGLLRLARQSDECHKFTSEHENVRGAGPLVFVSAELFWGCHDREEPTYREFTTLCAINSIVGFNKPPVLIRRQMLIARQLGFKTPEVMTVGLTKGCPEPLTVRQLRDTLDSLEGRGLIVRCQASPRNVYFKTSGTAEELRLEIAEIKAHRAKLELRRALDRSGWDKGHNGTITGPPKDHLKREGEKPVEKGPLKKEGPHEAHNGAAIGATNGTTKGATKIIAFKEELLNKSPLRNDGTSLVVENGGIQTVEKLRAEASVAPSTFGPPSLVEVTALFGEYRKPPALAEQWFSTFAADPKWLTRDWRAKALSWAMDARRNRPEPETTNGADE